jgi:fructose-bisphosphate aldolase class II
MLVPMLEILNHAKKGGYGVLAPNVFNEDTVRVCLEAAVELDSPIIIDVLEDNTKDLVTFGKIITMLAETVRVPVALNLDHGQNDTACMKAIYGGFTGIMCDRSFLSFEENAKEVAKFKEICEPLGVTVEAEFGMIADGADYAEKRDQYLTDPKLAKKFVELSRCDCLAVSIGEAHGEYTNGAPNIDFDLLETLTREVSIPLVFHGGSFSGFDNIAKVCRIGCQKVNMGTDAYNHGLEMLLNNEEVKKGINIGARRGGNIMWEGYKERMIDYMKVTGSVGKNWIKIVD